MDRTATPASAGSQALADGAAEHPLVPPRGNSELALSLLRLPPGVKLALGDRERDTLLLVADGGGALSLDGGTHELGVGSAALLVRGEEGSVDAAADGMAVVRALVGAGGDVHAPMGPRETVTRLDETPAGAATGNRSFQILYGPHNGSVLATFFVGYIPPGAAAVHYHLYDEIVWVLAGSGRLHLGGEVSELAQGSAFRLAPRERHVVENTRADDDLVVLGLFTPAGSPSAAYLDA